MSTLPDNEFDLEKLFLPAWAQEAPSSAKYAKYEGEPERPDRRGDRRGPRPPLRDRPPGERREGNRPRREGENQFMPGRGRPPGADRGERRGDRPWQPRGGERRERREPPAPLPEIEATLIPEEKGVELLSRQIKMTGRAFPLFEIAQMILQKPDRYVVVFDVKKNAEGKVIQPLFVCALDDTLWLSEDEAVSHILRKHFNTFYQAERTATEPPKGKYTFVAQCGMSGVILGPPNYHDYQNQLRKLHSERFSRMPFEVYKSRVRIVRDEEVVKKWVEDQSWKTEYTCLNMPEPLRLGSMEAVEKHFRENHKENIVKSVESHRLLGTAARNLRSPELSRLVRSVWEDQRRFPLQIATVLSQQFASHGLQFFKVNKTVTHVCVARPHYLDLSVTPVSEGVKRIVDYINATPKCTRRRLVEALAPSPAAPAEAAPTALGEAPTAPEVTAAEAPAAAASPAPTEPGTAAPAAPIPQPKPQAPAEPAPTAEQTAVIGDLHWLIHQGHVIEFANGVLETAKKPQPKPPKPEPKPRPAEAAATTEVTPSGEAAADSGASIEAAQSAGTPTSESSTAPETGPGQGEPQSAAAAPTSAEPNTPEPEPPAGASAPAEPSIVPPEEPPKPEPVQAPAAEAPAQDPLPEPAQPGSPAPANETPAHSQP